MSVNVGDLYAYKDVWIVEITDVNSEFVEFVFVYHKYAPSFVERNNKPIPIESFYDTTYTKIYSRPQDISV